MSRYYCCYLQNTIRKLPSYCAALCLFGSFFCHAVDSIPTGLTRINLTTGEGYFPYVDKTLDEGGWSQSLVRHTFRLMGFDVDIDILPWARGMKWAEESKFLGTFPYVYSSQRAEQFLYSQAINTVPMRFYVAKNSAITHHDQLQSKRLCIPYGYTLGKVEPIVLTRYAMTLSHAKDSKGCIGQVQRGWSDAGLTNGYVDVRLLSVPYQDKDAIVVLSEDITTETLHFLISKDYPQAEAWMNKFNQAFDELQKSGEKSRIDQQFIRQITQAPGY